MSDNKKQPNNNKWRGGGNYWKKNFHKRKNDKLRDQEIDNDNDTDKPKKIRRIQTKITYNNDDGCPYKGWSLYFSEAYTESIGHKVEIFQDYFQDVSHIYDMNEIQLNKYFIVNYEYMVNHDSIFEPRFPTLKHEIKRLPNLIINVMGLAMYQIILKHNDIGENCLTKINARIINLKRNVAVEDIVHKTLGQLISFKGTVMSIGNSKLFPVKLAFRCNTCNDICVERCDDGACNEPNVCSNQECKGTSFTKQLSHKETVYCDVQFIRVQELESAQNIQSKSMPKSIQCQLLYDLTDTVVPGDLVIITGIVKAQNTELFNKDNNLMSLYIDVNSIVSEKSNGSSSGMKIKDEKVRKLSAWDFSTNSSSDQVDQTVENDELIEDIRSSKNLFRLLVNSICPSVYGHELIKVGLLLSLFGGSLEYSDSKQVDSKRGDIHVLIVGDPGLGKSQMLSSMAALVPRTVYVSGNSASAAGLTVTAHKNRDHSDYTLEGGALVLADKGCCCLDELDKMTNQHQALLEAMEQQSVSLAKGGVVCKLPTRTSIIAAANPVDGHYNMGKTVCENIKMRPALLSRFDLIFLLQDNSNKNLDDLLTDHVLKVHKQLSVSYRTSDLNNLKYCPRLKEQLRIKPTEKLDIIPTILLQKYISYARQHIDPNISLEVGQRLRKFYVELSTNQRNNALPITARQLESLFRFAQARAKLELRSEVSMEDADDVIELFKNTVYDSYANDLVANVLMAKGIGTSFADRRKKLLIVLQNEIVTKNQDTFSVKQMEDIAKNRGIFKNDKDFQRIYQSLNDDGLLLLDGNSKYRIRQTK